MKAETIATLQAARSERRAVTLATRLSDAAEALVYRDKAEGPLAGDAAIVSAARRAMDIGRSETVELGRLMLTGPETDRERGDDVLVFDPTRVVDGIEVTEDPILRFRHHAYAVSVQRRSGVAIA